MKYIITAYAAAMLLFLGATAFAAPTVVDLENDQAIRANNGVVEFTVRSDSPFAVFLDGKIVALGGSDTSETTLVTLTDVDRGTRVLRVQEDNPDGPYTELTVHVLRVSAI